MLLKNIIYAITIFVVVGITTKLTIDFMIIQLNFVSTKN